MILSEPGTTRPLNLSSPPPHPPDPKITYRTVCVWLSCRALTLHNLLSSYLCQTLSYSWHVWKLAVLLSASSTCESQRLWAGQVTAKLVGKEEEETSVRLSFGCSDYSKPTGPRQRGRSKNSFHILEILWDKEFCFVSSPTSNWLESKMKMLQLKSKKNRNVE